MSPAAPVTREEISAAFSTAGHALPDYNKSSALVTLCLQMCRQFGLTGQELVDHWESYSVNNNSSSGGGGGGAELTTAALDGMAAQLGKRKNITAGGSSAPTSAHKRPSVVTPRPVDNRSLLTNKSLDDMDFGSPGSPASGPKRQKTNLSPSGLGTTGGGGSDLSPVSVQTPPDEMDGTYSTRANAGQRVVDYNPNKLSTASGKLSGRDATRVYCLVTPVEEVGVSEAFRFMFTPLEERAQSLERQLVSLREDMVRAYKLDDEGITPVGVPRQDVVNVVGRICCEAAEGRINRMSVVLEGSRRESRGNRVHLSLQEMKQFALFPGQVVAARGINSSGTSMVVTGLIEGVPRPLSTTPPKELLRLQHSHEAGAAAGLPISIMVACGPFSTSEDLVYQPLMDLLEVVKKTRPDVVILAGPFVDETHPKIASGEAKLEVDDGLEEYVDFETLFKYRISGKLESFFDMAPDSPTQFVLVPSLKDAFTECVYPQAPLHDRVKGGVKVNLGAFEDTMFTLDIPRTGGSKKRVHLAGNPAMLRINEVVVGVTSTDVLFDMTNEEVSVISGSRIPRLTEHLLQQQSFYPLFPSPANSNAQLDLRHLAKWRMPVTPDILLVPSRLTYFARNIKGCLCINPGQLARGRHGGTFATVTIHPIAKDVLKEKISEAAEATAAAAAAASKADGDGEDGEGGSGGGGGGGGGGDEGEVEAAGMPHLVAERSVVQVLRI